MIRYEEEVGKYFKSLFDKIDTEQKGFITSQTLIEALGGEAITFADKRTFDMIW